MNKKEKKEITLGTTVKAVITGYVAYGILIGFIAYMVGVLINWVIGLLPNANTRVLSITVPLLGVCFIFYIIRCVCSLSIHDVFKKCKTNPDNLPQVFTRLNLCIIIFIAIFVVATIGILMINFNSEKQSIVVSSYQYKTIHSEEFATELTNEMLNQFEEEKTNKIISTIILELGMVTSLFSVIPLQKKLITEDNEF